MPVYGDTEHFLGKARAALGDDLGWLPALPPRDAAFEVIDDLRDDAATGRFGDAQIAYGPAGPPWCSDALLAAIAKRSTTSSTIVHTHLLETHGERRFGAREHERGAVGALADLGLLSDRLLIAHGVWLDTRDCHLLARSGVSVVTNPSSNLRLHAGIAPIRELLEAGVNVALGTDNLTLGGEDEILQDARLLRALQRTPEVSDTGIDVGLILSMATKNGGLAIGRPDVGVLSPGAVGDAVLVNLAGRRDALRMDCDPRELALASRPTAISHTIAAGRILVHDGEPVIETCRPSVRWPSTSDRKRVQALMPLVRQHYDPRD
jgi:cytosine/adenosine deaminase-related metal-dependent hydrolase